MIVAEKQITDGDLGKANGAPPASLAGSSGFDSHPEIFYESYEKFRGWNSGAIGPNCPHLEGLSC